VPQTTQSPGNVERRTTGDFVAIWKAIVERFTENYVFDFFNN
jgi:hypothetical protein